MASWRERVTVYRNVHLGSTKMIDAEKARQKARKIKAEAVSYSLSLRRPEGLISLF